MTAIADFLHNIGQAPDGLTLAELLEQHPDTTRRTAQRRLALLLDEGKIVAEGDGPSRRYHSAKAQTGAQTNAPASAPDAGGGDGFPGLSIDSADILAYISQPVAARIPVGYQRDMLDDYLPNTTFYLPESLRLQLHKMGATGPGQAPAGTYGRTVMERLLIDLSWASSNLEGNTYSLLNTRELILHGTEAAGKGAMETQMILNHKSAIELLLENAAELGFNRYTLMNLHSALAENLLPNRADEGRIRQHIVQIGQSVYIPLSVPQQIEETLDVLLDKADRIADPFEQSFFVMVHLPYLQPFADINKRTSRLLANLPLFKANLCPLTFLDVRPDAYSRAILGVYEMGRTELLRDLYTWAYERSTQKYLAVKQQLAEPDPARLAWRELIKQTVREVVTQPGADAFALVQAVVKAKVPERERNNVQALIVAELSGMHEGVLARYGLRPSQFAEWRARQAVP